MFENPRRGRQARNFTTNASKILHLKSSSEQIFSRKLPLGAPAQCLAVVELQSSQLSTAVARRLKPHTCIFFREYFLHNALKTFPVTQFRSSERRKLHFRESNFTNLPGGGMPPDQLNHFIRYFQMLPKTLQAICQFLFFL